MKKDYRKRVFEIIQMANGSDFLSRAFDIVIITLIVLSIVVTFLQTFRLSAGMVRILYYADSFCMIIFSIEYVLRLLTADLLFPESKYPLFDYIKSTDAIIDLLSILPFYLSGIIPPGVVVFRLIRVARILKLFRINKYSDPISVIISIVKRKASQLVASVFLVIVLMLAASILMYYAEHDGQPEAFSSAFSGIWWAVATLSTTGYGDIYPITTLGRLIAMIITLLGMFVVAIPTGILTAGFMETVSTTSVDAANDLSADSNRRIFDISNGQTNIIAPYHLYADGNTIEQISLSRCVGKCIVETVNGELNPEKIVGILNGYSAAASKRLIFRGDCRLSLKTAEYLNEIGIVLVGVEADTIGDVDINYELLKKNMVILEKLELTEVEDGEYFLSAAPVKLAGSDDAPVRAFLMSM